MPGGIEPKTEDRDLTGTKLESDSTSEVAKTDTVAKGKQKVPDQDQSETPQEPIMDLKDILMKLPRELLVRMLDLEWTENLLTTLVEAKDSKFAVESHPKFAFYNAVRSIEEGKADQVESIIKNMKGIDIPHWKQVEIELFADLPISKLFTCSEVANLSTVNEKVLIDLLFLTSFWWNSTSVAKAKNEKIKQIALALQSIGGTNNILEGPLNLDKFYEIDWKLFTQAPLKSVILDCLVNRLTNVINCSDRIIQMNSQRPFSDDFLIFLVKFAYKSGLFNSLFQEKKNDKQFILEAIRVNPDIYNIASETVQKDPEVYAAAARHYDNLSGQSTGQDVLANMRFQLIGAKARTEDKDLKEKIQTMRGDVTKSFYPRSLAEFPFAIDSKNPMIKRQVEHRFIEAAKTLGIELKPVVPPRAPTKEKERISQFDNRSPFQNLVLEALNEFKEQRPFNSQNRIFKLNDYIEITVDPDKNKVSLIKVSIINGKQFPIDILNEDREEETNKIVLTDEAAKPFLDHWRNSLKELKASKAKP